MRRSRSCAMRPLGDKIQNPQKSHKTSNDDNQMKFITLAALPVAFSSGVFNYRPESDEGPDSWASIYLGNGANNQCGGSQQSGIDLPTGSCDVYEDYVYAVRTVFV